MERKARQDGLETREAILAAAAAEFAELVALPRIAAGRRGGHPLPADHVFAFGTWPGALADWISLSVR